MKAARIQAFGGPEVFRIDEVDRAEPGAGEVLLQVKSAGVNFFETEMRAGLLPWVSLPHTPGLDAAGVITAVGPGVDAGRLGQQALVYPNISCGDCGPCISGWENRCQHFSLIGLTRPGTYAEFVTLPAHNAIPFEGLSFDEAASVTTPWMTTWHLLRRRANIQAGQTLLVIGAGGGAGSAAVQIARLAGARVFAATSSPDKARRLKELGAEAVFDYKKGDPWQEARDLTGGRGLDFVMDYGGAQTVGRSVGALVQGGSVLIIGSVTGDELPGLNLRTLYFNHLSLIGSASGTREDLRQVLREMRRGALRPIHDRAFPLAAAGSAHEAMASPDKFGCITLTP